MSTLLTRAGPFKVARHAGDPRWLRVVCRNEVTIEIAGDIERILNAAYRAELAASKRRKGK